MKTDEAKRHYAVAEEKTDLLLDRLKARPWTLIALVATHAAAFVLGARLF